MEICEKALKKPQLLLESKYCNFLFHFLGVRDTLCDVRDLRPGYDYKFRIRVENKHGVSEPSPYTTAHRSKIYEPPKPQDFLPKGYEIEHPPLQKYCKLSLTSVTFFSAV